HHVRVYSLVLEGAECRYRNRQDRRLRVCGQSQVFFGSLKTKARQIHVERAVRPCEDLSSLRRALPERLAHSNLLRSLARKNDCGLHLEPSRPAATAAPS